MSRHSCIAEHQPQGAPGDHWQCPDCNEPWIAQPAGPLYIRWLAERELEEKAHEARSLAKRQCPYSGQRLHAHGNVQIPEGTLSCWVCDCFGFDPKEVGLPAPK